MCKKAKGIIDKLDALQHSISNNDLVEFIKAGLGPTYRPFTQALKAWQDVISYDTLYGVLLNEERQLQLEELAVIAPIAHYRQP